MRKDAEAGVALLKVRAATRPGLRRQLLVGCCLASSRLLRWRSVLLFFEALGCSGCVSLPSQRQPCLAVQEAAAEGNGMALYSLGLCHWRGEGTPVDFTAARECLSRAADQGVLMAADVLVMLEAGGGEG